MSIIELFWYLDVNETTKYLIILGIMMCVLLMCIFNGKKKNKNKKRTKCQSKYLKCMKNNIKNNKNDFCYPCLPNGNPPDFFFNPQTNQLLTP